MTRKKGDREEIPTRTCSYAKRNVSRKFVLSTPSINLPSNIGFVRK